MKLRFLCPKKDVPADSITNLYGTGRGEYAHFHDKWAYHPTKDRFKVANCTVTPFFDAEGRTLRKCLSRDQMRQKSSGKFRLFCLAEFPPKNVMDYRIEGPLTSHWLFPEVRPGMDFRITQPEFVVDLETTYQLIIDNKFLEVERDFMTQSAETDYVGGYPRLWAAEPYARGKGLCDRKVRGCMQGIPANPPMLLPGITLRVNRKRTKTLIDEVNPLYWPTSEEGLTVLLDNIDNTVLDLIDGLRQLSSAEDGYIGIKPMTKVMIRVTWQVTPIYVINKWSGAILLDRWTQGIKSLEVGYFLSFCDFCVCAGSGCTHIYLVSRVNNW